MPARMGEIMIAHGEVSLGAASFCAPSAAPKLAVSQLTGGPCCDARATTATRFRGGLPEVV